MIRTLFISFGALLAINTQAAAIPSSHQKPGTVVCRSDLESPRGEIEQRLFIGSEYADPSCRVSRQMVPVNDGQAFGKMTVAEIDAGNDQVNIQIDGSGEEGWLSSCFIGSEEHNQFEGYYDRKLQFIRDRELIYRHCTGRAQTGTLNNYRFKVRLDQVPSDDEHLILARWKGTPDSDRHILAGKYQGSVRLKEGGDYISLIQKGAAFETTAFDPMTLEVRDGFLALIARSDSGPLTLEQNCDFKDLRKTSIGDSRKCQGKSKVTLIHKVKADQVLKRDEWTSMTVRAVWSKYDGIRPIPGKVFWFINRKSVALWKGDVGRNDNIGPYFTLGAELEKGNDPIEVSYKGIAFRHNMIGYNVNLIKNPNNYGRYENTWKSDSRRSRSGSPYLHNRVKWGYGGAATGFFATPYYNVSRYQEIDIGRFFESNRGKSKSVPRILVGQQFNRTYCGNDRYSLTATLLDGNRQVIDRWTTGPKVVKGPCKWGGDQKWVTETHVFRNYKRLPKYIRFSDSGQDSEYWAGYYGSRMREATVIIEQK
ncbi:heparin lyase I family protein [Parendozoicomonas sp. Alg238-R29]|uniref:heparin lyase I family protein n=1 Tax=Parendozoicomonas sp. Alg238-R29 TaxID=2993446 RepID=UPI00248ED433|nr:heparin lyase I family protein [Parendozoicomonas sp. Alg238-R29]